MSHSPTRVASGWSRIADEQFMVKTILAIWCPKCEAPAGQYCRRGSKQIPVFCSERVTLAKETS